mgnify:CR=1
MRSPKYGGTGRSGSGYSRSGKAFMSQLEMMEAKWFAEVMNSKRKRGDRSKRINLDD